MSQSLKLAFSGTNFRLPVIKLSTTVTSWPWSIKKYATLLPIYPAPPVSNIFNPYALSKYNLEKYLIGQSKKLNIKFIILRYFNVAGAEEKMRTGLVSKHSSHLIKVACEVATKKRKNLIINGNDYDTIDGTPVRDFIHISDLSEMHLLSALDLVKNEKSNIFNCGYGKGFSVLQVINVLNKNLGYNISTSFGNRRDGDIASIVANSKKFSNYFSWSPKYQNLSLILKSSLEWENKIKKLDN